MNGLLILDKPPGLTSFDVVRKVRGRLKRLTGQRALKVGHAGTLDPFATGVLLVCVGQGTRLAQHLTEARKRYRATLRLGQATTTDDCDGEPLAPPAPTDHLDPDAVRDAIVALRGDHMQVPPAFSAIHVDGKRAYALARKGHDVQLPPRPITLDAIDLLNIDLPDVTFDVVASKGTYIRAICRDLGEQLGVGGHCLALRRLASSGFDLSRALPLDDVLDHLDLDAIAQRLVSPLEMVHALPRVRVSPDLARDLHHGKRPYLPDLHHPPQTTVAVTHDDRTLVCIAEVLPGHLLRPLRVLPDDSGAPPA